MIQASSFLDALRQDADRAGRAEDEYRHEVAARTKALEQERAFAHRRLNFMCAVAETVVAADSEAVAVAAAKSVMRNKLGWGGDDDEARAEVLERFAPVAQQVFKGLAPADDEAPPPDVLAALNAFEAWYGSTHPGPFWALFEHYMPETPLVDF